MIKFLLINVYDGITNVAGLFDTREEAEAKKAQRETEEANWKIYDRHEYAIIPLVVLDVEE